MGVPSSIRQQRMEKLYLEWMALLDPVAHAPIQSDHQPTCDNRIPNLDSLCHILILVHDYVFEHGHSVGQDLLKKQYRLVV